ncbi:hypothetical protein EMIHUDRAFT_254639 [Emiliania huxleyi CCMP1516]|uniref:Uncharacterized protein n=2 Tax=Emiliania huxleyi TaxID=2903 RepID=A0A0D3JPA8_EMIH1|nr:hypothetical protein EMIHUDRAFT_254639 [Emiliania huxleyi CCMP1516]EOD25343.1 hypothetical protein EMIHUDRAFT_254639 [Emiliania huxleyi CCMP1516]|eukprot:XP_005777772.1 hypothetical protein EMIHUDRAFT_254639 [Emiliania huxleyi CCMP1516]
MSEDRAAMSVAAIARTAARPRNSTIDAAQRLGGALEAYAASAAGARVIRRDRHFFANQTHHDVVRAFLQRVRPGPDPRTGFVDIEFEHGRRTDALVAAGWLSGGREYATTPSADPFRLPRPIRSTALARFGLDFDDGAAHARAALAVIGVHRELAAEFLRGETREKVLVANRWSWERLAKTKGGSGGSDTNNEGNDHTGRRMTLGKRARERIGENRSPGRTEGGAPGPRTKQVSVWAWCPV